MKRLFLSKTVQRLLPAFARKNESGQAVILLALGFVALLAFVGIVTDVSLMFVRYSTLSRAVDAAAIASAGQMRSDRSFGEVGLAARQFIEFHGLDPLDVLVETCETTPGDPGLCPPDQRKLVRVTATIISPTIFMRLLGFGNIQLTAVAVSETAVLDVVIMMDVSESMLFDTTYEQWADIGYGKVYVPPRLGGNYEPSIGDQPVPASNPPAGNDKPDPYDTLAFAPQEMGTVFQREFADQFGRTTGVRNWMPQKLSTDSYLLPMYDDLLVNSTHETISQRLQYSSGTSSPIADPQYPVQVFDYPGTTNQQEPRSLCKVRFWPYSARVPVRQEVRDLYQSLGVTWQGGNWDGFVPSYDFYGCCNDPTAGGQVGLNGQLTPLPGNTINNTGDFRFNDLICQPFKQARDATRQFLERIDFARGDRVAFITFDKSAFVIDPDGSAGVPIAQSPCPADEVAGAGGRTELTHMIESECRAVNTLNTYLGVRAEPNSYVWKEEGGWDGFADGLDENGESKRINYQETRLQVPQAEWDTTGNVAPNTYPVRDHCPLQNGSLSYFKSRYSLWDRGQNNLNQLGSALPGLVRIMMPSTTSGPWASAGLDERHSYELWASCRNTNIGAALRTGSSALLDPNTTRRTGTVWVMVLLGDGAAGGSDPARQNGRKLRDGSFVNSDGIYTEPSVYADHGSLKTAWENWGGFTDNIRYGTDDPNRRAEYGAFGVCPFGTPGARSSLTRPYGPTDVARFPFCSDEDPRSRHFALPPDEAENLREQVGGTCDGTTGPTYQPGFRPGAKDLDFECNPTLGTGQTVDTYNLEQGNVYDLDIGQWDYNGQQVGASPFDPRYDVDDYARDWADYIALSQGSTDEQLPTIFTIGFGLNFEIGSSGDPEADNYIPGAASLNVADYLGEELLRYIADVGDNFQIDTDYQQDWLDDGFQNNSVTDYGVRGPCERQQAAAGTYEPLLPRVSCGNYYNAPNQEQLELVFDDIASRMFTRLTG
jgi:hypothetical protein